MERENSLQNYVNSDIIHILIILKEDKYMKCNLKSGIDEVCYKYEKCPQAFLCKNVPEGIREKLKKERETDKNKEKI